MPETMQTHRKGERRDIYRMKLGEITMRNGAYCRMRVEEPDKEWTASFLEKKNFKDMADAERSGYAGSMEIECQYDGKEISDVAVVFFFNDYEKISDKFSEEEINLIKEYLHENFELVPDNAELDLGDIEWQELAYTENGEGQMKMGN